MAALTLKAPQVWKGGYDLVGTAVTEPFLSRPNLSQFPPFPITFCPRLPPTSLPNLIWPYLLWHATAIYCHMDQAICIGGQAIYTYTGPLVTVVYALFLSQRQVRCMVQMSALATELANGLL